MTTQNLIIRTGSTYTRVADRVTNATSDLTLLCDTLAACGPDEDLDSLTPEDKAEIELNLLATAQSILAVLHLAGFDVKGAIDCLADVVEAMDAEDDVELTTRTAAEAVAPYFAGQQLANTLAVRAAESHIFAPSRSDGDDR